MDRLAHIEQTTEKPALPVLDATALDTLCVNTIRTLAIDAIQQANSGHPGTPMGMAPMVYTLWQRVLRFDPQDPIWPNRDRFVLSAGHASTLLYAVLHLTGTRAIGADYHVDGGPAVSLEDIRTFRQRGSRCAGHPEYRWTSGVETTTGPLGQGVATSVGLAIGARWLAARYNRPGFDLFDYNVYALCGDGCLMEGISSEAASLAGHLRLANLCWVYDSNRVTIEGHTDLAFTENVAARFLAYGWQVVRVGNANDLEEIDRALHAFRITSDRPTLIIVDSLIGYGSPHRQDTSLAHGEPLGEEEIRLTKQAYSWPPNQKFLVPDGVREHFARGIGRRGLKLRRSWEASFEQYGRQYPNEADQITRMQRHDLPDDWDAALPTFAADAKGVSGRDASGTVMNAVAARVPWFLGGAADLAPSTKTRLTIEDAGEQQSYRPGGRNLHFGVREHAMTAIVNGLALTGLRSFGAGFLIFSDYARGAIRLSALMELPVVHIFTHDSIGVGEDGPTHQPIEQLISLRAIPHLTVLRPADANEVVEAWKEIMTSKRHPTALILSRQAMPTFDRTRYGSATGVARGGYVLAEPQDGPPDVVLIASGSEVSLCVNAIEPLRAEGIRARVVSMPSWELFEQQTQEYRDSVLPPAVSARVAVEQASTLGWERYVGQGGAVLGMTTFGMSAPLAVLQKEFGFTTEHVVALAREQVHRAKLSAAERV
jgi:transketolase